MGAIHIRDLSKETIEALKRRARRNHRSLQQELKRILSEIGQEEPPAERLPPIDLHLSEAGGNSTWSREEIYRDDGR
jgi:plasmid stability protein